MIDNRLKKCCDGCEYGDVFTDEICESGPCIGYKYTVTVGCKHMHVCKYYNNVHGKEPVFKNGTLVFEDANGDIIGTGEDLMRGAPARLDIPPCGFTRCRFYSNGNCGEKNMYKNCEYRRLKQKEIEEGKSSIKINATP